MFYSRCFLLLALCTQLPGCIHSKDYARETLELTEGGRNVQLSSQELLKECKSLGHVIGKGQSHNINGAVAAAMKDGQNKAAAKEIATLRYVSTDAKKHWRTHFVAIRFETYACPKSESMVSELKKKSVGSQIEAATHASATAESQAQIEAEAAAQAASQAAAQAASQAASQAAAQAAAQAAQAASQAAQAAAQAGQAAAAHHSMPMH